MTHTKAYTISKSHPLVLVGAGKMGSALLQGWISSDLSLDAIHVMDPHLSAATQKQLDTYQITHIAALKDIPTPSILCLAVKPQIMARVLDELKPLSQRADTQDMLVCSIAAGIRVQKLKHAFPDSTIIRAMPNISATVKRSVTALYSQQPRTEETTTFIETLMQVIGQTIWVEREDDFDLITAISGSGPAYVFHLVEAMAKAGATFGLDPNTAMTIARHTVSGAGELLFQSNEPASVLRQNVTSPQGTTEAGLSVLMAQSGLCHLIEKTIQAAHNRAKELGQES